MWVDDVKAFSEQFDSSEDKDWQETRQLKNHFTPGVVDPSETVTQ